MPSKKKKYNSRFPPARIKKIMQTDEDVGKVAAAVPVIISRSLELFIESLIEKTAVITKVKNAKTLTATHIKQTIHSEKTFDFLHDLVANVPDHQADDDGDGTSTSLATGAAAAEPKPKRTYKPRKPREDGRRGPGRPRKVNVVPETNSASATTSENEDDSDDDDDDDDDGCPVDYTPRLPVPGVAVPTPELAAPMPELAAPMPTSSQLEPRRWEIAPPNILDTTHPNTNFTQPLPTQPHPSQPHPTQPHPTQSHPSQPHPTQPHPTQPQPFQPHSTQPHSTQTHPTQPHPSPPHPSPPHPTQPHSTQAHPTQAHPIQAHSTQPYPTPPNANQPHPNQLHSTHFHQTQPPITQPHPTPPHPHMSSGVNTHSQSVPRPSLCSANGPQSYIRPLVQSPPGDPPPRRAPAPPSTFQPTSNAPPAQLYSPQTSLPAHGLLQPGVSLASPPATSPATTQVGPFSPHRLPHMLSPSPPSFLGRHPFFASSPHQAFPAAAGIQPPMFTSPPRLYKAEPHVPSVSHTNNSDLDCMPLDMSMAGNSRSAVTCGRGVSGPAQPSSAPMDQTVTVRPATDTKPAAFHRPFLPNVSQNTDSVSPSGLSLPAGPGAGLQELHTAGSGSKGGPNPGPTNNGAATSTPSVPYAGLATLMNRAAQRRPSSDNDDYDT